MNQPSSRRKNRMLVPVSGLILATSIAVTPYQRRSIWLPAVEATEAFDNASDPFGSEGEGNSTGDGTDPFGSGEAGDPFGGSADPFGNGDSGDPFRSDSNPFGSDNNDGSDGDNTDPFGSGEAGDPFGGSADPFGNGDSGDPFRSDSNPFGSDNNDGSDGDNTDPFGSGEAGDPFGGSADPFGNGDSGDPFRSDSNPFGSDNNEGASDATREFPRHLLGFLQPGQHIAISIRSPHGAHVVVFRDETDKEIHRDAQQLEIAELRRKYPRVEQQALDLIRSNDLQSSKKRSEPAKAKIEIGRVAPMQYAVVLHTGVDYVLIKNEKGYQYAYATAQIGRISWNDGKPNLHLVGPNQQAAVVRAKR